MATNQQFPQLTKNIRNYCHLMVFTAYSPVPGHIAKILWHCLAISLN